jgi:hypothetical protein
MFGVAPGDEVSGAGLLDNGYSRNGNCEILTGHVCS